MARPRANMLTRPYEMLTEKQKLFIEYYIQTQNATESARKAGYNAKNDKNMQAIGFRLKMDLKPYIEQRLDNSKVKKAIADTDEILEILSKIARGEEKDAFGLDTSNQDKLKALELLGKANQLYVERVKQDTNVDINVNLVDENEEEPMLVEAQDVSKEALEPVEDAKLLGEGESE